MLLRRGIIRYSEGELALLRETAERFIILPETPEIAWEAVTADLPHKDPFDRVFVATARCHSLALITKDDRITASGLVKVCW